MTATPVPDIPPETGADLTTAGAEFFLGSAIFLGSAAVVSIVLYRTARFKPEAMVVISVSVLTITAIFAATVVLTENISTALISLAGVGLGALAGAVRSLFREEDAKKNGPPEGNPDTIAPVDEGE